MLEQAFRGMADKSDECDIDRTIVCKLEFLCLITEKVVEEYDAEKGDKTLPCGMPLLMWNFGDWYSIIYILVFRNKFFIQHIL